MSGTYTAGDEALLTAVPGFQRLLKIARQIAGLDCPVLLLGEQGTGRRALARFLHSKGPQAGNPFHLAQCGNPNCDTVDEALFGSEPGTVLLEDVELLPPALQARLTQVLETEEDSKRRLVASTAANLAALATAGQFRPDLLVLLQVVTLTMPPLIRRRDDIPALALHFLAKANNEAGKSVLSLSDEALALLAAYDYLGNVQELDTVIRRAVALCRGDRLEPAHLPPAVRAAGDSLREARLQTLEEREREYTMWVLGEVGGNQTMAAKVLGIDRASLWRKLKRWEETAV